MKDLREVGRKMIIYETSAKKDGNTMIKDMGKDKEIGESPRGPMGEEERQKESLGKVETATGSH